MTLIETYEDKCYECKPLFHIGPSHPSCTTCKGTGVYEQREYKVTYNATYNYDTRKLDWSSHLGGKTGEADQLLAEALKQGINDADRR